MDAPHSDNEAEVKEEAKSIQHSQSKTKDNENAESSDESSGQGNSTNFCVFVTRVSIGVTSR